MADDFNELNFDPETEDLFGDEFFEGTKEDSKKSKKPILLIVIALVLAILIGYVVIKITSNHSSDDAVITFASDEIQKTEESDNDSQIPTSDSNFSAEAEAIISSKDPDGLPQKVVPDIKPVTFNPNKPSVEVPLAPIPDTKNTSESTGNSVSSVQKPVIRPEKIQTDEPEPTKIRPLAKKHYVPSKSNVTGWQVQLISLSDKARVEAERDRLVSKYPSLFAGRDFAITEAKLSNGKLTNRLRVVGFSGRVSADSFCRSAKAQGIDCYIVPR